MFCGAHVASKIKVPRFSPGRSLEALSELSSETETECSSEGFPPVLHQSA